MLSKLYTKQATFGMALPYFLEVAEVQGESVVANSPATREEIGQVFGDQTVIVFGRTSDGQLWRLIYPDETASCWVMPCRTKASVRLVNYQATGEWANVITTA